MQILCQDSSKQQDRFKYLLKDECIFIVIDESEVDKTKFINVIVGDIDVPRKRISSSAALLRP